MLRRIAIIAFILNFPTTIANALAEDATPSVNEFAKTRIGEFRISAETIVDWKDNKPFVKNVQCLARSPAFTLWMDRFNEAHLTITGDGPPDSDGSPQYQFGTQNILWIGIDSRKFETKPIQINYPPYQFTDVRYAQQTGDDIQLSEFRGHLAFREGPQSAWLKIDGLISEISGTKRILIGIKEWDYDHEKTFHVRSIRVEVGHMREALKWCDDEVHSASAYKLYSSAAD